MSSLVSARATPTGSPQVKMSSRPRSAITPRVLGTTRAALGSHNDNLPDSPSSMLSPAPDRPKIKVKAPTTPEARPRVLVKPKPASGLGSSNGPSKGRPIPFPIDTKDVWTNESNHTANVLQNLEPTPSLAKSERVLVSIRVRPPSEAELRQSSQIAWVTPAYDLRMIKPAVVRDAARDKKEWFFDRIIDPETDNARTYATAARAHVLSAMEGYNAVIFAYGQTASGKTFTLTGAPHSPGIIPLAIADLFQQIRASPDREWLLRASYLELYNETIIDLLSPDGRELTLSEGRRKGEVVINGLTECGVRTEDEVRRLLRMGEERRKVGGTDWNARSSRSHCVFRMTIESRTGMDGSKTPGRDKATRISTLSIIDLAGSEKHTSSKERNVEGRHINQSLLTLKLVISKLADMASNRDVKHVPYRDSKLTRLLQPSLSGDALISVICTISPAVINMAESNSTLNFAQGLKRVMLSAQRKEVVDPEALIQQYQNEIADLKSQLREREFDNPSMSSKSDNAKSQEMSSRLNELMSLILTSSSVDNLAVPGTPAARPLSPAKLKYHVDMAQPEAILREQLHEAELKAQEQAEEIERLKAALDARPVEPNAKILELQEEVSQLRMIAADYERHLREPSRKVKQDVEREWTDKYQRLEEKMRVKTVYALRLDENCRMLTESNKNMAMRCNVAEAKVNAIIQWISEALKGEGEGEDDDLPTLDSEAFPKAARESLDADFGPKVTRLSKLSMSMRGSNRDLQSEFSKFRGSLGGMGSLGPAPPRSGGLFRDDSAPSFLATVDDDDFLF
ncbi:kinesin-domain-containing protein [Cutaneotrichosporon oleaginosum]|uniref:Kinesin-like protein n=1 Tax=Cutaneotrichosporon oleaginosum TaxID=879819 RepID=A0A0J0XNS4_9TREE|nr:kinesin-domain-containing protein [Cutaneotrichosporon oleaginosum]KLT42727.1 kinesin-domain-containing protein [Cutaneotrichosporon oleaginosum]TXT09554.1 hypothetical protein COLE_03488 [Cutaneotrichosporon oleaginosum]